jgi:ectoine hydroxylase-related dioxygenase (phytanoyl-CoA dioxygenase family)
MDANAATHLEELEVHGYTIIPDLMSEDRLSQAREKCEDWLEDYAARKIGGGEVRGRYRKGLLPVTRWFDDLYVYPLILDIVSAVFKPDDFYLAGAMIKVVVPGEEVRDMHRDDGIFHEPEMRSPGMINTLLALDDFSRETGATHLVPGSHRWDGPVDQNHEYVSAQMPAGSLLMLHGRLWHQNGRNHTADQERKALSFSYHRRVLQHPGRDAFRQGGADLPEALQRIL